MGFPSNYKTRSFVAVVNVQSMINAGLSKEQYEIPEYLAQYFIDLWTSSGENRTAGAAVCVSAKGLYHMHMALYSKNSTTLQNVASILGKAHVEPQMGGKDELTAYLLKEGKYAEKGEHVLYTQGLEVIEDKQGKRNDLEVIEELLNNGLTSEQIFEESFRYRKYEKMVKAAYLAKRIRETPLVKNMNNEWHFGKSGTGKTYTYIKLCEEYSPEEVYLCNDYANSGTSGGGFDLYTNNPAKIIVLDEFRGGMGYANLLSLMDIYSRHQQHCRYQNTYNLWESVIICSIFPPEEVYEMMVSYSQKSIDTLQQLMRRLNTIVYHYINSKGEYKSYSLPASEYKDAESMIKLAEQEERKNGSTIDTFEPVNEKENPFGKLHP